MTFFYDINRKLAEIAKTPQQLNEDKGFPAYAKGRQKYGDGMEELSKAARNGASEKTMDKIRDKHDRYKDKVDEASTSDYSAKKAAAGKDIGKPGKNFSKISKSAAERYGSAERGRKVAGAMLKQLRDKEAKNESKMADQDYDEDGKIETGSEEYLGSRDRAIKKAMGKNKSNKLGKTVKEDEADFLGGDDPTDQHGNLRLSPAGAAKVQNHPKYDPNRSANAQYSDHFDQRGFQRMSHDQAVEVGKHPEYNPNLPANAQHHLLNKSGNMQAMKEEVKTTARGRIHKAGAGGYGRKFDTDEEGNEKNNAKPVAKTPAKRGRPSSKDTHDTEGLAKIMGMGQAPKAAKGKGRVIKKADVEPEERTKPAGMPLRSAMTKRPTKYRGSSDIDEGFDDVQDQGEYGQEGDMAKDQLYTLTKAAAELSSILDDDQDLPEWVQSKITKALEFINTSNDYMDQERHDSDDMEKLDELSPDTLTSYADKAKGQRGWAFGRAEAGRQGNRAADPEGKFDRLHQKRAAGYNQAVAKGARDLDKTGQKSSWNYDNNPQPAALKEKAVSVSQQQAAGVALQAKRAGKTPPGKGAAAAMSKMSEKDLEKFAKTKHKGLPEKKGKKKEEVEETTTAGAVATAPTSGKAGKGGMQFGKGIYDSWNRELEQVIAESMNISMNMNSDSHGGPGRSLTVTATDEDAGKLAELLKMAGIGSSDSGCGCGASPCACNSTEMVDENKPDWPTNTETSNNALQYAGGLNKPKTDVAGNGQTTVPVTAVHSQSQDELRRMMEMAGLASIEEDNINIDSMTKDEVNAALKNRPRDPVDDMTSDEVNAALKNRPRDPVDDMSDDEVNAAFNASLDRIKEMAGLGEGDVPPKPINPFPIGQDALSPQEKLNPPNANVGVFQGLKRFITNPTKGGMEEQADSMDTDPETGRVRMTFQPGKKDDQSTLPLTPHSSDDRVGGPKHLSTGEPTGPTDTKNYDDDVEIFERPMDEASELQHAMRGIKRFVKGKPGALDTREKYAGQAAFATDPAKRDQAMKRMDRVQGVIDRVDAETMGTMKEESKPDYIDLDRDGNKKESMKQAAKDADHNEIKESLFNMNQLWKPYRG